MVNRWFMQQAPRPVQGTIRITLYVIYITGFISPTSSGRNIYSSCKSSKPFKLNVHVVPHTHNDVGWVRTVDQYYYGKEFPKGVFKGGVQHILNSVIEELLLNKERKFTYVETAFFWKWYIRQSVWRRNEVRMLVQQGRLQFAGGAWTMNDEASTHYQCIIDQFTYGIKKLNYTFGAWAIPTAGWQIDPFGHSREFASLLAAMGFDGLFLGRIDYEDKSMRHERKSLEMIWRGDDDLGNRSDIFTSVLYNLYQPPPSFCYTEKCRTPESQQVEDFIRWVFEQAQHYVTNHVLVTMGDDFAYKDAGVWYRNMDKLIENANLKSNKDGLDLNVFYSTPSCYLKAVKDIMPTLPTKQDDFFPYASEPNAYWTGFYTSRPTLKYFVKQGNTIFQMARQLQVLVDLDEENQLILDSLAAALGVLQHHDAITGTSKQHVVNDYIRTLHRAIDKSLLIFNQAYYKLSGSYGTEKDLKFEMCALNESRCDVSENTHQFVVMVFNPLPWQRIHVLRVPVGNHAFFTVRNPSGVVIKSEMQEIFKGFQKNTDRVMVAEYELVFAVKLQATGYKAYYVTENSRKKRFSPLANKGHLVDSLGYTLHSRHGYVEQHGVKFYSAYGKTDHRHQLVRGRPSGAYIFHPKSSQTTFLKLQQSFGRRNFIATEQLNILDHNFAYILRSNKKEFLPFDEMEWQIGPINVNDYTGKEFVITHKLNINNKGIFYTDSNGRQMIQRHVNKRVQWNATITNIISGNYYPITNEIAIENNDVRYIVLTDRACGATSLNPGEIEIMIHRRLLHDDGLGVDEALNEVESELGIVVRGTHKFLIVPTKYKSVSDAIAVRRVEIESQYDPIVLFADAADIEYNEWMKMKNIYSGIKTLDIGISILTIAPWRDGSFLLRLENILSKKTGLPEKDLIRTVHITKLFKDIQVISVRETLLAANGWVKDYDRWEWKTQNRFNNSFEESFQSKKDKPESILYNVTSKTAHAIIINLRPKQIRTFIVKYRFIDYL